MTITCPACGFENRDKAHFCLGCAKPIQDPVTAAAEQAARRERASAARKRRRRRKMPSPNRTRNLRVFLAVGALAAALLIGGLVRLLQHSGATPAAAATATTASPAPPTASPPAQSAADAPPEAATETSEAAPTDAVERLRLSVEQIEREDRARALAREQQVRAAAAQRRRGDDARSPAQVGPSENASAPAAHDNGPAPAPAAPAPSPAASSPSASAAATAATPVDQLCANAGNMLMRDLCRIRECAKPAHAQDGVCVRFRKMDDERKAQDEYR